MTDEEVTAVSTVIRADGGQYYVDMSGSQQDLLVNPTVEPTSDLDAGGEDALPQSYDGQYKLFKTLAEVTGCS